MFFLGTFEFRIVLLMQDSVIVGPAMRTGVATPAVAMVRIPPAMVKPPPTRLTLVPIVLLTCDRDLIKSTAVDLW